MLFGANVLVLLHVTLQYSFAEVWKPENWLLYTIYIYTGACSWILIISSEVVILTILGSVDAGPTEAGNSSTPQWDPPHH